MKWEQNRKYWNFIPVSIMNAENWTLILKYSSYYFASFSFHLSIQLYTLFLLAAAKIISVINFYKFANVDYIFGTCILIVVINGQN